MNKILSVIIVTIWTIILLYSSFLIQSWSSYEKPNFDTNSGSFNFDLGQNQEISKKESSKTKVNYLNNSDKILTFDSNFTVNNTEINIEKWFYLFNFNSLDKKYKINFENFNIEIDSPASIFVNNFENNIKIISIDNIIKLNFLWINWENKGQILNSSFLYPNQYVVFDGNKNFLIKNADLLRITQLISLWYFPEKIILNWELNKNFKKIFLTKDSEINSEIEKLFLYIFADFTKKEKIIKNFFDKRFFEEDENSLTNKYENLLINDNKKAIFLKNNILKDIREILKDKKNISTKWEKLKSEIENLKNISEEEQKNILDTIKFFVSYVNTNKKYDNELKIFFEKIINPNFSIIWKSENLDLNASFFNYNFSENQNFYSEIKNYIEKRAKEKTENNEQNYFIFFLNKLILANIKEKNPNFEDTINIFKNYVNVWTKYYSMEDEQKQDLKTKVIETWLVNFEMILNNILIWIEKNYFTKSGNWLLSQKTGKNLKRESIETLTKSVKKIYEEFYETNKNVINSSNSYLTKNYDNNFKKFEELEIALRDFDKYLIKYDGKNSILLNQSSEKNNVFDDSLSKQKAKDFLNKFNQIIFDDSNIEIMWEKFCNNPNSENFKNEKQNPTCYKISNITVWNNVNVSFILDPNDYHRISNIEIGWDKTINKWSYKVDILEDWYEESNSTSDEALKFENFFVDIIIWSWQVSQKSEIFEETNRNTESSIIRTLKNTALLGNNWTLTKLKSFLKVDYNNLIVKETADWSEYIINIENAEIKVKSKDTEYSWKFSSNYKFKAWKTNSFFNPEIKFSNESWNDPMYWEKLKISWFIDLAKFQGITEKIWEKLKNISEAIMYIKSKDSSALNIVYFHTTDKFQIIWENSKLVTSWDKIEEFVLFWKKILENWEKIYNISNLNK